MTKLLEQAIERVHEMPKDEQGLAAAEILDLLTDFPSADELAAIAEGQGAFQRREVVEFEQWRNDIMEGRVR